MPYDFANAAQVVRLSSTHVPESVEKQLRALLTRKPKKLHTSLSYDPDGSTLFAELCNQPEYYLTRTEFSLLYREAQSIIEACDPDAIVDLGCGNFEKTQVLIHEAIKQKSSIDFIPCDIDEHIITSSIPHLAHFYGAGLRVQALVGAYETCLSYLASGARARLFAFIGSTYGNLTASERGSLLEALSENMGSEDYFLLGVDLVKQPAVLEAAYNDSAGCIRASMLQMLVNLNREYSANFDLDSFDHVCVFEPERRCVVSYVVSNVDQRVRVEALDLDVDLEAGEWIEAEIREKFVVHDLLRDLAAYRFTPVRVMIADSHPYALILMRKDPAA